MGAQYNFEGPEFNRSIRIEARPERLSSDAGALMLREVAERLGLLAWLQRRLDDPRDPLLVTHPTMEVVLTTLLLQAQGWSDQDDADRMRQDPVLRLAVSSRGGDAALRPSPAEEQAPEGLASQPTLSRALGWLSSETNRRVLDNALLFTAGQRIRAANGGHRLRDETLDIDSLPIEVFGEQPGSEYNGHYHGDVYHPLIASLGGQRDLVGVMLRPGSLHTAADAIPFILDKVAWMKAEVCQRVTVRLDAGFPDDNLLKALEEKGIRYVSRKATNPALDKLARAHLDRHLNGSGRQEGLWCYELRYQAESWSRARRVVLVIQVEPGELFARHFYLVTNISALQLPALSLLELYRQRGNAEAAMGEWKSVLAPSLSSSPRPKKTYRGKPLPPPAPTVDDDGEVVSIEEQALEARRRSFQINETSLILSALAYNLMNAIRKTAEAGTHEGWSIRRTREQVLKVGAQVLLHARAVTIAIPESCSRIWEVIWYKLAHLQSRPLYLKSS